MKQKFLIIVLLIVVIIISFLIIYKEKSFPKTTNTFCPHWIKGTWHNSTESNMENFVFLNFSNDTIIFVRGFEKRNVEILNEKYADYNIVTEKSDSLFKIKFNRENDTIIYEFKLHILDWGQKHRALSYSLIENGIVKYEHTTSSPSVLLSMEYIDNF